MSLGLDIPRSHIRTLVLRFTLFMNLRSHHTLRPQFVCHEFFMAFGVGAVCSFFLATGALAQMDEPKRTELRSPLGIPLILAGNFGELRPDHFHTGLDFKTQGKEGFPVLAASDGVVARVKVSPYGYGNALYLSSPGGLTTVYAHLRSFVEPISSWVLEGQYRNKEFGVDVFPKRAFVFSQGDTIGWSGNSGSSGGPHLHFEVRDSRSERPLNPLLWDLPVMDHRNPEIDALWILPEGACRINGSSRPYRAHHAEDSVRVDGSVRLAIEALDRLDAAENVCGIYAAEVRVDSVLWYRWALDTLDFGINRDMNAHAYYPQWESGRKPVHRLHRLPGNRLPIYRSVDLSGVLEVPKGQTVEVLIRVWDIHGNESEKKWVLQGGATGGIASYLGPEDAVVENLMYDVSFRYVTSDGGEVEVPAHAFYDDFTWSMSSAESGLVWDIGDWRQPSRKAFDVRLPMPALGSVDGGWVAMEVDRQDERGQVIAAYEKSGKLEFKTRRCGKYRLMQDSVPPVIRLQERRFMLEGEVWRLLPGQTELRFTVFDALSGVAHVEGFLNGTWVLMRWDPKRERLWYEMADGIHRRGVSEHFEVHVTDKVGLVTSWKGDVIFEK